MATTTLQTITEHYAQSLTEYLHGAGESALEQAYEIGRSALADGMGVLDLAKLHQEALAEIFSSETFSGGSATVAARAANFLVESLSPFEMTHRGFRDTIASLREHSAELTRLNQELERSLAFLRATHDATADGILVISRNGTIESYNHRLQEMWQMTKPLHTGETADFALTDIFNQLQHPDQFRKEIRDFIVSGEHNRLFMLFTKDGRVFECYSHPQRLGTDPGRVLSFRDITARRRAEEALRSLTKRVVEIQEEERQRVSRELHDDVCQRLTAIKLHMELFEDDLKGAPADSKERFGEIKHQVIDAITATRRISSNLRPTALDDFGLVVALQHLCAQFEKLHNIKISFQANGSSPHRYDTQMEIALYRIAQEALSNIAKHADAERVTMKLSNPNASIVALDVEDTGKGFELEEVQHHKSPRRGMGLISMKERSELLGGSFRIQSEPKQGTKIHVEIPVSQ